VADSGAQISFGALRSRARFRTTSALGAGAWLWRVEEAWESGSGCLWPGATRRLQGQQKRQV
jgi:hypothetical protein